jgi:hypothetical protein
MQSFCVVQAVSSVSCVVPHTFDSDHVPDHGIPGCVLLNVQPHFCGVSSFINLCFACPAGIMPVTWSPPDPGICATAQACFPAASYPLKGIVPMQSPERHIFMQSSCREQT